MADGSYADIGESLQRLYVEDDRPWLVGFSGGKDTTMVASRRWPASRNWPVAKRSPRS
jgi:DNA sulfur modification protein DndC